MTTREQASTGFARRPASCQAGSRRLQTYCIDEFHLANSGCFNKDSELSSGRPSWHAYGKAIDLGCWWWDAADKADGMRAWEWVLANKEALNLQQMIFGNMIVDVRDGYKLRTYDGFDHYNHIHIAIGYVASQVWRQTSVAPPTPPSTKKKVLMSFIQVHGIEAIAVTDGVNGKRIFKTPTEYLTAAWLCGVQGGNPTVSFVDKAYWDSLPTLNR